MVQGAKGEHKLGPGAGEGGGEHKEKPGSHKGRNRQHEKKPGA